MEKLDDNPNICSLRNRKMCGSINVDTIKITNMVRTLNDHVNEMALQSLSNWNLPWFIEVIKTAITVACMHLITINLTSPSAINKLLKFQEAQRNNKTSVDDNLNFCVSKPAIKKVVKPNHNNLFNEK
tara:strand:+ start:171 stop:554 length:384 start_codon:yes stop_codon:yes gene_type:complete